MQKRVGLQHVSSCVEVEVGVYTAEAPPSSFSSRRPPRQPGGSDQRMPVREAPYESIMHRSLFRTPRKKTDVGFSTMRVCVWGWVGVLYCFVVRLFT